MFNTDLQVLQSSAQDSPTSLLLPELSVQLTVVTVTGSSSTFMQNLSVQGAKPLFPQLKRCYLFCEYRIYCTDCVTITHYDTITE